LKTPLLKENRGRGLFFVLLISSLAIAALDIGTASAQSETIEVTVDSQPRMTSILVDNVIYLPSQLPVKFSWEQDSTHTIAVPAMSSYEGTGKRYDFVQWNDLSPSLSRTIEASEDMPVKDFIAILKTRYLVMLYSDYGSPSGAGWYDEGATAELRIAPSEAFVETTPGKIRQAFAGWSTGYKPASLANYVEVSGPTVVLANWKEQYMLSVASAITPGSGSGWYDSGAIARASVPATVELAEQGIKYSFKEWQAFGSDRFVSDRTHQSTDVVVDGPVTLSPQWNELYLVEIDSNIGNPTGQDYYAAGDIASITIDPIYETEPGKTRFILSGWEGAELDISASNSFEIRVDGPVSLKPVWTEQHHIKVNSMYGMVEGGGWHDEGSQAALKLQSREVETGLGKKAEFAGWSTMSQGSALSSAGEYKIDSVSGPVEVTAIWNSNDGTQLSLIIAALAAVAVTGALTVIINLRRRKIVQPDKRSPDNWRVRG
jgi:hypothetical protein